MPYGPRTGEAIKRIPQRADIRVFFNSPNTIGRFLGNEKNKIPTINRGHVVYKLGCECGTCYIGQTGRSLKDRIYEHKKCSEKQTRSYKDEENLEEKLAIALHAIKTGHIVAFERAQPVKTNVRNSFERLVAEQPTIKATEKKNCNRKGASTLSPTWIPLLPRLLT